MKFHWKIFLTIMFAIIGISLVYVTLTHFIVKRSIEAGIRETRGAEVALLARELADYYAGNGQTWAGIERRNLLEAIGRDNPSLIVRDKHNQVIVQQGDALLPVISRLGVKQEVAVQGTSIGHLYYYDPEVANLNKILIGIPISVVIALAGSGLLLMLAALVIAYQLSRWLAAPLMALLPPIERLGRGELGVQAPNRVDDEYGKIAGAFNLMSTRLEKSEELRRNLTADVAHELRTPLTIIGGKLEVLQQQGQPVAPETLLPLQDELIRLNRLVEDLRTLSSAEAGKLLLNREETDLAELARSLCEAMEPLAEEKGVSLRLAVLADRTTAAVDAGRIKQVLLNLLTNAIRYTAEQGVVQLQIRNDGDRELILVVEDSGIGIAAEHLPHIFDRFYRTDEARTRVDGGTGLGLAIAKQLILSHQGTIEVESQPGQGTRFVIRLPLIDIENCCQ